jgi:hypothetical protein
MTSPFNTSLRRGSGEPRDLLARVDAEVRDRIGEAVDFVCLQAMVESRRAAGLPAPAPDSARDRAEFDRRVETFLARLATVLTPALDEAQHQALAAAARPQGDRLAQLVAVQVTLAKLLPDYWQRFEAVRLAYAGERDDPPASGGDRARWIERLFRR